MYHLMSGLGCAVAKWLRHYTTNRQVPGLNLGGVIGIFLWHNPSGRTMALGSTQPLKETSIRCISWGYRRPVVRLTSLPPSCAVVMKSWNLNFLEPSGHSRLVTGLLYLYLYLVSGLICILLHFTYLIVFHVIFVFSVVWRAGNWHIICVVLL